MNKHELEKSKLTAELSEIYIEAVKGFGPDETISTQIATALKSKDLETLRSAMKSFNDKPEQVKKCIRNGWFTDIDPPDDEESTSFYLDIGFWESPEPNKYGTHLAEEDDAHLIQIHRANAYSEDRYKPDIEMKIKEGTPEDKVIQFLRQTLSILENNWNMLVGQNSFGCQRFYTFKKEKITKFIETDPYFIRRIDPD